MAKLSEKERNDLSSKLFGLPEKHMFPMPDEEHVHLAWDMVDRAKGISDAERATARENIIRRAHELGIDTSSWDKSKVHASGELGECGTASCTNAKKVWASGFMLGDPNQHPNRMPFAGILTWFDVPSDNPPHGSEGRAVMIPSSVGLPALDSIIGQAVNFVVDSDWGEHNPQDKIGVITSAHVGEPIDNGGVPVFVEGFIYAQDFEDAAMAIKLSQHQLGMSYETANTVLTDGEFNGLPVAIVSELGYFTGASILLKNKAAYTSTSIAASADTKEGKNSVADNKKVEVTQDHVDALKSLKAAIQHIDAITDSIMAQFGIPDPDKDGMQAAGNNQEDNANANDGNNGMQADSALSPNGEDPVTGKEIPAVHASAETTPAATASTTASSSVENPGVESGNLQAAAEVEALKAQLAEAQAKAQEAEAKLQAAADAKAAQRTSIAYPSLMASKFDGKTPEDEYTKLLASIDADATLTDDERWAKKIEARDAHLARLRAQK